MSAPTVAPVDCKWGAPMGRAESAPRPTPKTRWHLRRLKVNRQGYDTGGAYWGVGKPLFHAQTEFGDLVRYYRAYRREEAKDLLQADFPGALFFV